jgi:hypothetical protein
MLADAMVFHQRLCYQARAVLSASIVIVAGFNSKSSKVADGAITLPHGLKDIQATSKTW